MVSRISSEIRMFHTQKTTGNKNDGNYAETARYKYEFADLRLFHRRLRTRHLAGRLELKRAGPRSIFESCSGPASGLGVSGPPDHRTSHMVARCPTTATRIYMGIYARTARTAAQGRARWLTALYVVQEPPWITTAGRLCRDSHRIFAVSLAALGWGFAAAHEGRGTAFRGAVAMPSIPVTLRPAFS